MEEGKPWLMKSGRRWIVLDADFFANHFTDRVLDRFGPAGVCLFVALLCAAKRSRIQGQITYASDSEAFDILGLRHLQLVDNAGDKWTLDDFWKFTGTQKQTRRSTRGHVKNVKVTGWSQWQETLTREKASERMRRLRADSTRTGGEQAANEDRTSSAHDNDNDIKNPKPQAGGDPPDPASTSRTNGNNPRARGTNPRAAGTNPRAKTAEARRELIPEWHPEPPPDSTIAQDAVADLRANPSRKIP